MSDFSNLGLSQTMLNAVELLGYEAPTEVQAQAIPLVLDGRDVIAAAKTGTGKTAAFSLPGMDVIGRAARHEGPLMLVITPTRELANQIAEVCSAIATVSHHRIGCVVGGVSLDPQIQRLKKGVDVLIATPGRLIDLMNQGAVNLDGVKLLVLDEADRMLDMGFLPSVKTIVEATPSTRQTLLFSATIDHSVRKQVGSMLTEPSIVQVANKGETADTVEQFVIHVAHNFKFDLLKAVLEEYGSQRVIVFARTRGRADSTCRKLKRLGYSAEALHSDRSQNQRRRALDNFASGQTDIIVATDVLARGIDVEEVSYVVNFDLPTIAEDYVHRIGRTGRAGARGFALSFVSTETEDALKEIQKFIKHEIPVREIRGFNPEESAREAAERVARASMRHDPELAQAARELAKKKRKKEKAREKAQEEAAQLAAKPARKPKRSSAPSSTGKTKRSSAASASRGAAKNASPKKAASGKPASRSSKGAGSAKKASGASGNSSQRRSSSQRGRRS